MNAPDIEQATNPTTERAASTVPAGPPSTEPDAELRHALGHDDPWVRLHAVSSLARRTSDAALTGLVFALHDESFGVHWAAATALAAHGRTGVVMVLRAMLHDEPTTGFLHGAARVLHHATLSEAERQAVAPVLDALHRPAADLEAPVLASVALERLGAAAQPSERAAQEPWWRIRRDRRGLRGHIFAPGLESLS
jgi:HEAT repeat protein